jgi:hypothetical protein
MADLLGDGPWCGGERLPQEPPTGHRKSRETLAKWTQGQEAASGSSWSVWSELSDFSHLICSIFAKSSKTFLLPFALVFASLDGFALVCCFGATSKLLLHQWLELARRSI